MKRRSLALLPALLIGVGFAGALRAQNDKSAFKPQELDQMLAPIALYPDSLLSQILMAAGYPLEIVEAARWLTSNPKLKGMDAVNAAKNKGWDASVTSLLAFPDVLNNMNDHLDWTQKLGDAMIDQQKDVADSVQRLRAKAAAAGNLKSTPQQTVTAQGSGENVQYVIAPANPEVIYVPAYNPTWVYGPWPYPAYPPTYNPMVGALATGFMFGVGVAAAGAMFGGWNWNHGNSYVNVNVNRAVNIDNNYNRTRINANGQWQHDPAHRRGVGYRSPYARQEYGQRRLGTEQREQFRGRLDGNSNFTNRPGEGIRGGGSRPEANRWGGERPNAFGGADRGQQVNRESARGRQQMDRAESHGNFRGSWGGERGERRR